MAYDEALATRVRTVLAVRNDVIEKKMFGGLTFMVGGHMCCGLVGSDLMVRVGLEAYEGALSRPHARPMDFTGRTLKGMVYVRPPGIETEQQLVSWVDQAVAFVLNLPPESSKPRPRRKSLGSRF